MPKVTLQPCSACCGWLPGRPPPLLLAPCLVGYVAQAYWPPWPISAFLAVHRWSSAESASPCTPRQAEASMRTAVQMAAVQASRAQSQA